MRPLDPETAAALVLAAGRIRREVDGIAADLLERVAEGDRTALALLSDRLEEIGRPDQAERFRKLLEE